MGLDDIWLDRLTLNRVIGPLGPILLGLGVTAACLAAATGGRWELALAAGTTGWLIVRLTLYLGRLALGGGVMRAIDAATAAIRR